MSFFMELFHFKFVVFLHMILFLEHLLIICDATGRCLEVENSTLLQLKKGFITKNLKSWQPGTDCCIWEGATCDEYGRIIGLNLELKFITGTINPSLFNLTSLETLNLSFNNFDGIPIPDFGWDRLVNLTSLVLFGTGFNGQVPTSISHLTKLTFLDLSCNSLAINPMILQNMSSLKELILNNVIVSSYRDEWCGVLVNSTPMLELLSMYNCSLFGAICSALPMLPFLSSINFGHNNFDSSIPDSFANFSSLSNLQLLQNKFKGFFPIQIFQLRNLKFLDISYNPMLSGYLPDFPEYNNLNTLITSNTNFSGNLPDAIGNLKFLKILDLSSCQFYGTMPSSIGNLSELTFLDLSNNKFNGVVGVEFPSNTISQSHLAWLSLENNNLIGEITPFICNSTRLMMLNLSKNKLIGTIPPCLLEGGINLRVLNLRENQLHGAIHHEISQECKLEIINLRDNQLEGFLPRSLSNCLLLKILDLGNNNLKDTFPYWLGNMHLLSILNLRSNKFYGSIEPSDGSYETSYAFSMMQVFDISSNNLSGNLSTKFFSSFKSMLRNEITIHPMDHLYKVTIINKGQLMTLENYYSILIDFSNNHFEGKIPSIIGQLVSLQVLNFSHNYLTGEIPPELGNLEQLESLDLSRNYLFGKIPQKFVSLHFLSYLNLSYNKLVGIVPQGGQLCSFTNTSFEGNEGLHLFFCDTSVLAANNTTTSPPSLGDKSPNKITYMIVLAILFGVGFGGSMAAVLLLDVLFCHKASHE